MGRDIHVKIVKRNRNTNEWSQIKLYKKTEEKFIPVKVYPFRHYELFDILSHRDEGYNDFPLSLVGLSDEELKNEIERCRSTTGYYSFRENTLADLKLYLFQYPKVRDWDFDEDSPNAWKVNPVDFFVKKIEHYIDFADPYWKLDTSLSDIKVFYWFDC